MIFKVEPIWSKLEIRTRTCRRIQIRDNFPLMLEKSAENTHSYCHLSFPLYWYPSSQLTSAVNFLATGSYFQFSKGFLAGARSMHFYIFLLFVFLGCNLLFIFLDSYRILFFNEGRLFLLSDKFLLH